MAKGKPKSNKTFWIYCTECRKFFCVRGRPRPRQKVRCLCGVMGDVRNEFHLFATEKQAAAFAKTHRELIAEVKETLATDGLLVVTDRSSSDEANRSLQGSFEDEEAPKLAAVEAAGRDAVARHEALNELIEFYDRFRASIPAAREKCVEACKLDVDLTPELIKRAKKDAGRTKLRFIAFRRLATIYSTGGEVLSAIEVCEQARRLGLKGYEERIEEFRAMLSSD